jgi:O-antigen/teichoic acid export membrane protein
VGIEPAVIQNERGDDTRFLNTAWTIQVVRGVALWLLAVLLAWPFATLYEEPLLMWLVPVGSLNVLILGLASTSLMTLRRRLAIGRLMGLDIAGQLVALSIMIPWAYLAPSVWPLIVGGLGNALFRAVISHALPVGYRNRFEWDTEAKDAIIRFGKWIFGSSALFFISKQADRLMLGRLLGTGLLGVYSIALFLSEAVAMAVSKITHGVFYPVFSRVRHDGHERLREVYYRTRLYTDAAALTATGCLIVLGEWVVHALYDERYAMAGWMLQALCVRVAMNCVLLPCETCLFSLGHTRYGFYQNVARSFWILAGIPIAWSYWQLQGVVWITALSEIPVLFVLWPAFARVGMLRIGAELRGVGFFGVGAALGYVLLRSMHALGWQ